jgi:hypothetical protein
MVLSMQGKTGGFISTPSPKKEGHSMRTDQWLRGVAAFAACLFGFSSVLANTIPSRKNSDYGINGMTTTYNSVASLNDLNGNGGTFISDPTPPAGFNLQVLCPISSGCAPGGMSYGWALETTAPLATGSQITINFGSDFFFDSSNQWVGFMTCDSSNTIVGLFCMPPANVPSGQCSNEFSQSDNGNSNKTSIVTISLPTDAACIPSTLVFTSSQFVDLGESPTFGTVTVSTVSTPEPSTLLLAIAGLMGLPFVRRRFSYHA